MLIEVENFSFVYKKQLNSLLTLLCNDGWQILIASNKMHPDQISGRHQGHKWVRQRIIKWGEVNL